MLHRDYLLEVISQFVEGISRSLRRAVLDADMGEARRVEDGVAALLELDPSTAMSLSPDSLVSMMLLSGMGDSVASYVCYALDRVGDAYDVAGDRGRAALRWDQAQAVAESFGCSPDHVPPEFRELDDELAAADGGGDAAAGEPEL